MNNSAAYTPLESLLLFQSLIVYGTEATSFNRISDLLKNNDLIRNASGYEPSRLSPDSLREFYLQLLREEIRNDEEITEDQEQNGGPANPKKRKLPSPPLPTVKEPSEHRDKLPMLVERLYARYREHMIRSIKDDEKRYEIVLREISEIEREEREERERERERAAKEDTTTAGRKPPSPVTDTRAPSSRPALANTTAPSAPLRPTVPEPKEVDRSRTRPPGDQANRNRTQPPAPAVSAPPSRPEGLAIKDVLNSREPSRTSSPRRVEPPAPILPSPGAGVQSAVRHNSQSGPSTGRSPAIGSASSPVSAQPSPQFPPNTLRWQQAQTGPNPPPQGLPPQAHQAQQMQYTHSYGHTPQNYSQYAPHYQHRPQQPTGPYPSPTFPPPANSLPSSPPNRGPPNPIVLPPPNSGRGSGSPSLPAGTPGGQSQQHRPQSQTPQPQPWSSRPPGHAPPPPNSNLSPINQYGPGYSPYYYLDNNGRSLPQPSSQFNPALQAPRPPTLPYPSRPENPTPEAHRPYNSPYVPNSNLQSVLNQDSANGPSSAAATPRPRLPLPASRPHTPALGPRPPITGSATKWSGKPTESTPRKPEKPASPMVPGLAPLSPKEPKSILPPARAVPAGRRGSRSSIIPSPNTETPAEAPSAKKPRGRAPTRGTKSGQRGRAGSTASSAVSPSRRSRSVASHADELSLDTQSAANARVKQESATPRTFDDVGDTTADESTSKRPLGSFSTVRGTKRKRQDSLPREPPRPATHVIWTRNFPKISMSALESITGHRYASTFAAPVKERDAPGYRDLILQPQDLKSIRAAINAGNRAATAAAAELGEDSGQASILLPISEDLIPPKGIINSAQLEKELMRMFANAIMFNADPNAGFGRTFALDDDAEEDMPGAENYEMDKNGVVKETRSMFFDTERIVGELRAAERKSEASSVVSAAFAGSAAEHAREVEDSEADELAGDGEGNAGSRTRKR